MLNIKGTNPTENKLKLETNRLLMKQSANKCNINQFKEYLEQSMNISNNISNLNNSVDTSLLDLSNMKTVEKRTQINKVLKKLIQSNS